MWAVAVVYWASGRTDEAIPQLEEVLRLRKSKLGPEHGQTLQSMWGLASVYELADRLDDAGPLSEKALKLYEAKFGPNHPETVHMREVRDLALGRLLLQQKNYAEAEPLLAQDLDRNRKESNDWGRFEGESRLGASLLGQKQFDKAAPLLTRGYDGMKTYDAKYPARPWEVAWRLKHLTEAGERVVRLYAEWGKPEKAAEWRAKLAPKPPAESNKPKP
jgi:tetratricopeptide (TPR) repeat protein